MSHTGFLMHGWLVARPLMTSCRLDILWILWFPSTAADRLYTHCEHNVKMTGSLKKSQHTGQQKSSSNLEAILSLHYTVLSEGYLSRFALTFSSLRRSRDSP